MFSLTLKTISYPAANMNKVHYENKKYTSIASLIKNLYQKKASWNLTS